MLVVKPIAKMRRLSLVQSIKQICRELKVSREVVRKVPAFGANGVPLRAQASAVASAGCMAR